MTPSQPLQDDQQWHQQQPQVPSTAEDQSPVDVISESPVATSDRDWVIADKQQAMLDELLAMGVKRQELLDILSEMGQPADDGESLVCVCLCVLSSHHFSYDTPHHMHPVPQVTPHSGAIAEQHKSTAQRRPLLMLVRHRLDLCLSHSLPPCHAAVTIAGVACRASQLAAG